MKKIGLFLVAVFFISVGSSFQQVAAQEGTEAEQIREKELQQVIEQQKKAMIEQKIAQEEVAKAMKNQEFFLQDLMEDVDVSVGRAGDAVRIYNRSRGDRTYEPFVWSIPGSEPFNYRLMGDSERTTWDFSRSVKENTFSKEYTFDVDKTAKSVVMSVMGDCKAGEIRIKIEMPNGKDYSDIVIDEFGNLNWRKSFTISTTENQDKTGEWKFQVTSTKATGYFKISLQSS